MPDRRGRGRPRIVEGEESERVHFRIDATRNDRLCRVAVRTRRSIGAVIRAALDRYLDDEERHSVATK